MLGEFEQRAQLGGDVAERDALQGVTAPECLVVRFQCLLRGLALSSELIEEAGAVKVLPRCVKGWKSECVTAPSSGVVAVPQSQ